LVPASVSATLPPSKSSSARVMRPGGFAPAQPASDHQVDDEEQVVVEGEDDPLAQPPHAADDLAFSVADRRHRRAQHERIQQPYAPQHLSANLPVQGLAVDDDVGKLGHRRGAFCAAPAARCPSR
jgi:hypothetical protein